MEEPRLSSHCFRHCFRHCLAQTAYTAHTAHTAHTASGPRVLGSSPRQCACVLLLLLLLLLLEPASTCIAGLHSQRSTHSQRLAASGPGATNHLHHGLSWGDGKGPRRVGQVCQADEVRARWRLCLLRGGGHTGRHHGRPSARGGEAATARRADELDPRRSRSLLSLPHWARSRGCPPAAFPCPSAAFLCPSAAFPCLAPLAFPRLCLLPPCARAPRCMRGDVLCSDVLCLCCAGVPVLCSSLPCTVRTRSPCCPPSSRFLKGGKHLSLSASLCLPLSAGCACFARSCVLRARLAMRWCTVYRVPCSRHVHLRSQHVSQHVSCFTCLVSQHVSSFTTRVLFHVSCFTCRVSQHVFAHASSCHVCNAIMHELQRHYAVGACRVRMRQVAIDHVVLCMCVRW